MSYYYEVYIPNETEPRIYSAVRKLRGLPEGTVIWRTSEDDRYPVPVANGKAVVPSKRRANKACSGLGGLSPSQALPTPKQSSARRAVSKPAPSR